MCGRFSRASLDSTACGSWRTSTASFELSCDDSVAAGGFDDENGHTIDGIGLYFVNSFGANKIDVPDAKFRAQNFEF